MQPNDLTDKLRAGLRPTVEDVAKAMNCTLRPSPRPGWYEAENADGKILGMLRERV